MDQNEQNDAGGHISARRYFTLRDWISQLNGYDLRLWAYTHACSRLTLRATDRIARRPSVMLVFHDVSYVELPLTTGRVRAREANEEEALRVQRAMGGNFYASNVVAFVASEKRVFLLEYGYVQWLSEAHD